MGIERDSNGRDSARFAQTGSASLLAAAAEYRQAAQRAIPASQLSRGEYKETQKQYCIEQYEKMEHPLPLSFFVAKTPEIIEIADCAVMVSGSVSLEMLARRTPFVAMYRSSWLTYFIGCVVITCKYWSLPNLIANRIMMPERFSVGNPKPAVDLIVSDISKWLENPAALAEASKEIEQLRNQIHSTGATRRTADVIIGWLEKDSHAQPLRHSSRVDS